MQLKTERLTVRLPKPEDVNSYIKIRNSDYVRRYNPMGFLTPEQAKAEIGRGDDRVMMVERHDGALIGTIFIQPDHVRLWDKSVDMSFFLGEEFSAQGYMREAVNAVLGYIFGEKGMECVTVRAFAENTSSVKLIEKLGFKREGYLRKCVMVEGVLYDDILFSMLKEEF